jgi:hypothetical protein
MNVRAGSPDYVVPLGKPLTFEIYRREPAVGASEVTPVFRWLSYTAAGVVYVLMADGSGNVTLNSQSAYRLEGKSEVTNYTAFDVRLVITSGGQTLYDEPLDRGMTLVRQPPA